MVKIKKFIVNPLQENSYVIWDDTLECVFIDPGFYFEIEQKEIVDFVAKKNLKPVKIVNTHCHFDHILGVEFLREKFNVPFYIHADDEFWIEQAVLQGEMFGFDIKPIVKADGFYDENMNLKFGESELKIIHVPGHSPGHLVYYSAEEEFIVGGDVLFYGSIGRTDLPGGDYETLISAIWEKLFVLPDETTVYCGHGPETKIGFEKKTNPFLI